MAPHERWLAAGVSASFVLVCLASLLLLPPYEGFDETAHYSYVSFLATHHAIPNFQSTRLDANLEHDRRGLPRPYQTVPPYEVNGGITYHTFFNTRSAQERQQAFQHFWRSPPASSVYTPGGQLNWQGQHPPGYYLLLVLPYQLSQDWSPGWRLFLLRLVSVLIACSSLFFWLRSVQLFTSPAARHLLLSAGVTIVFFPSLAYEFARLGNDALVACLFSGVFYFLLSCVVHHQQRLRDFWGLGFFLGVGLVTKLFFVPVLLGVIAHTLWCGWRQAIGYRAILTRLCLVTLLPVVLSSWWFALYAARYGNILGLKDLSLQAALFPGIIAVLALGSLGGLTWWVWKYSTRKRSHVWKAVFVSAVLLSLLSFLATQTSLPTQDLVSLSDVHFLLHAWLRAAGGFATTFLWSGTWSWVRPSYTTYVCCVPLLMLTGYGWWRVVRHHDQYQPQTQAILVSTGFCLVPFLLGVIYFVYSVVTASSYTSVPWTAGYYVFAFWPLVGVVFAVSFQAAHTQRLTVITFCTFLVFLVFDVLGWWRSALVFSGVIHKVGALQTGVGFLVPTPQHMSLVIDRLAGLVFPHAAFLTYAVASVLRVLLVAWLIFRVLPQRDNPVVDHPNRPADTPPENCSIQESHNTA